MGHAAPIMAGIFWRYVSRRVSGQIEERKRKAAQMDATKPICMKIKHTMCEPFSDTFDWGNIHCSLIIGRLFYHLKPPP
jgi:hypothetical protein